MLAVSAVFPDTMLDHPPLILIHGSANSAAVWGFWQQALAEHGWASYAIDLRGHGQSGPRDLSHTSMQDYAADLTVLVTQCRRPPVLIGWSMGGLVALMVAATGVASACVGLAPVPRHVSSAPRWRYVRASLGERSMASRVAILTRSRPCLTWIARNA